MPKSFLLDILDEREKEAQSKQAAPVGRSIDSEQDAWDQALKDNPSTFSQTQKTQPQNNLWNPEPIKQPEVKNTFKAKPLEYSDAFTKQEEAKDAYSPTWENGEKKPKESGEKTNTLLDRLSSPKGMTHDEFQDKQSKANKIGTLVGGTLEQGSGVVVQGATSLMDNLFGGLGQELHTLANLTLDSLGVGESGAPLGEKNVISSIADWVRNTNKREAEYYGKNAEELGDFGKAFNKYGTMVVAAAPAAILAMMTSGASAPSTAGLQAYSAANTAGTEFGYLTNMCGNTIKEMAANPSFQTSFIQEAGHAYDEALADGASESEAALYSLLYSVWASTVEVGGGSENMGGLQKLPEQLRKALAAGDKSTVLKIVKSTLGEVGEENIQGILESGFKTMYQPTPIWGGDNAIINPQRMVEEAKGAAITSGVLGAGQAAATAIDARTHPLVNSENTTPKNKRLIDIQDDSDFTHIDYDDKTAQQQVQSQVHDQMVNDGKVVEIEESPDVKEHYPDLRSMPKKERTPILKEHIQKIKTNLRDFLSGLAKSNFEFEVNDGVLEAKLYNTGIKEVLDGLDKRKANMLYGTKEIFDNARYLYSTEDYGGNSDIYRWNYFYTPVKIGDDVFGVRIAIRDMANRDESQIYNWGIKNNDSLDDVGGGITRMPNPVSSESFSNDIISNDSKTVNNEDANSYDNPLLNNEEIPNLSEQQAGNGGDNGNGGNNFTTPNGEVFGGEQVPTQSNIHDQYTEEEAARPELNPENDTHEIHHDEEVETFANQRIESGAEQARSDLLSRDPASWDDVDVRTAQKIIEQELAEARNLEGAEQDAAYARIAEMRDAYNAQGTASGQALRQRQSFSGTPDEIESEAASVLFGKESEGKLRNMSPEQKTEVMNTVTDYSQRLENIGENDSADLIKLIGDIANTRKTKPLLDPNGKMLNKVLEKVSQMDGGMEFLRNLATTQTRSIASDYVNPGIINQLKAVRYMNMLSNPATASRNVGANTVFGTFIDAISNNMASPIDSLMSLATGQKSVAGDRMLSPEAIKASYEAGLKSWLEVSLDAEAEQANYAYDEIKGRTFKANSRNFIERVLSAFERNQGYQLKTTDQIAKGGIEAETKAGLERLGVNQKEALEIAKDEAKYRTLQNQSKVSDVAKGLRNTLNNIASVKDKQGGSYGLGDDILPFAQVPANVVKTELDLNPLSAIPAAKKVFDVMLKGENATIQEQRSAAKAFGRAANGTALVALSAILSSQGIIRYTDDDDSNLKQLHKAQGKSGLQINASAALRFLTGQGSEEKAGDKYINLGWLPQLNSLMIIGNMIYDDYKDMPEEKTFYDWANLGKKAGIDSLEGMYESILEFPAVSTITSMINAHKYANIDEESDLTKEQQRLLATGLDKVANTATGFVVPNALRGVAAGLDDTERDLYTQSGQLDQAIDYIKAGIPGLRETLPAQTDNYGNPIQNEGGVQNFLNKVVLPGAVTEDKDEPLLSEIERLYYETGNKKVVPNKNGSSSFTVDGIKYKPESADRRENHIVAGNIAEALTREFMLSPEYEEMDDNARADIISKFNSFAESAAKRKYAGYDVAVDFDNVLAEQVTKYKKETAKEDVTTARIENDVNLLLDSINAYSESGGSGKTYLTYEAKEQGFIKEGVSNDEGIVNYLLNNNIPDDKIDEVVEDYGTKKYKAAYSGARSAGASSKEASEIITTIDGYGEQGKDNNDLSQKELKSYAADHPEEEEIIRQIWNAIAVSQRWSKDYDGNKIEKDEAG